MKLIRNLDYFLIVFFLLVISSDGCCQFTSVYLDGNQNAPVRNWQVIRTPRFNIIFPEEISKDAKNVASTLEYVYDSVAKTMNFKPLKMSLIMSDQTTISNGFVSTVPRYSQWYSTPPQLSWGGSLDWYNLLASHETRHMVQIDKIRHSGINPVIHFLFGQTVFSVLMDFSVPGWFFEGDAVGNETAITSGGRGRLPEFDRDIRTLLLSGKRYSFTKAYMNSVKDYYPSVYELGYLMTTYVKRKYGSQAWSKVLQTASKVEFVPFSFGIATAVNCKVTNKKIYINTMNEVEKLWKEQLNGLKFTSGNKINLKKKTSWTNYKFPQYASDGSVICYKTGMDDIIRLIKIDKNGKETFLCYGPQTEDIPFKVTGHYVIWNEYRFDLRWGQRDYSIIRVYDLKTKKTRKITRKSKLFSPALSPDLNRIAVVEFTKDRKCQLVIIDFHTGKEIKRFENPRNEYIETPSWSEDGTKIVYCKIMPVHGKCMEMVEYVTDNTFDLLPYSYENFMKPVFYGNYILYNSPYSGIDNIYALSLSERQLFQVTSRKFASSYPCISPDSKKLIFNDYTVDGFDILEMPLNQDSFINLKNVEKKNIRYWEPLVKQESGRDIFKGIIQKDYPVEKYRTGMHLFDIHSWSFIHSLTTPQSFVASVSSLNYLNTMSFRLGYEYNLNEKTNSVFINGSYAQWFTIIDFGGIYGGRTSTYLEYNNARNKYDTVFYHWNEKTASLGLRIPFIFSRSVWYTVLSVSATSQFTRISNLSDFFSTAAYQNGEGDFLPVKYNLTYMRILQGRKDFNPRWGQLLTVNYYHTPFGGDYTGQMLSGTVDLYFPGILKHHSLLLQAAGEYQLPGNYRFASEFLFPRGYSYMFFNELYKGAVNYAFPVWYPDIHLGPVINFRQVRVNLFDDYATGIYYMDSSIPNLHDEFNSAGFEIITSLNLIHIPIPIEIGWRYSYLTTSNTSAYNFVFFGYGL